MVVCCDVVMYGGGYGLNVYVPPANLYVKALISNAMVFGV